MLNFTGRGRQRQVEKGRGRQRQVEKGRGRQRQIEKGKGVGNVPSLYITIIWQRQAEVGKVVGNVPSLYIPFISYQFGKMILCTLVHQVKAGKGR